MLKFIIAGGRNFSDYELLENAVDHFCYLQDDQDFEIVSGHAKGADQLGERYAKEHDIPLRYFPADWLKNGRSAGYIRNAEMEKYADAAICFWDGESKGTKNMIDLMTKHDKKVIVVRYSPK